jgi:hypothetical protein
MKKVVLYTLLVLGCLGVAFVSYRYSRRGPGVEPQKSVEEILIERQKQALGELNTPLGQAILAKNWDQAAALIKSLNKPHLNFANVIRALFIHNKTNELVVTDFDSLEILILELLELEPLRDELGYSLLSTQLYRLPLLSHETRSRKALEEMASSEKGGAYHHHAKLAALSKLIMQGAPPSDKAMKQFEGLLAPNTDMNPLAWMTVVDGIRHEQTQVRMIQHLSMRWRSLKPDVQAQAFTLFASSMQVPKGRELVLSAIQAVRTNESTALTESALRYLSALNEKAALNSRQKKDIINSLNRIDASQKSPFLSDKIKDLVKKLSL